MKNCPNCNTSVNGTAKFCNKCGFNIKKYEEESVSTNIFCEECGAKIPNGSAFCEECGFKIGGNIEKVSNEGFDFGAINNMATEQLFEKEGFVVENEVLTGYTGKKRSITIHNVEEIYDGAFENNDVITFVEIQEGVKIIGKKAFANCKSLIKINIPASVEKIYDDAFEGVCLDTLILPEIDMELIKQCLSDNARKYLNSDFISDCVLKSGAAVAINIKAIEKKTIGKEAERNAKAEAERKAELAKWEVGCNPTFGSYYYQSGSKQPIEWIVLERENNKALAISKYALDCKQYHTTKTNITWESCTLREWLNNEFINNAFNSEEQAKIQTTSVLTGNRTNDKIFLLSVDEARKYFATDSERKCKVTSYAKSNGAYVNEDGYGVWWLRSLSVMGGWYAMLIGSDAHISEIGEDVDSTTYGVRPALWINL